MAEKTPLIANRSMTYNTRRLLPDQPFEAKPREARVLVAIGKAREPGDEAPVSRPAPAPGPKAKAPRAPRAPRKPKA